MSDHMSPARQRKAMACAWIYDAVRRSGEPAPPTSDWINVIADAAGVLPSYARNLVDDGRKLLAKDMRA